MPYQLRHKDIHQNAPFALCNQAWPSGKLFFLEPGKMCTNAFSPRSACLPFPPYMLSQGKHWKRMCKYCSSSSSYSASQPKRKDADLSLVTSDFARATDKIPLIPLRRLGPVGKGGDSHQSSWPNILSPFILLRSGHASISHLLSATQGGT